ncbi:hypothetical protein AYK26_03715 [Euryarchaeota archaeon SM23-78]|nr:MAG: hypothetical protein AYK26_03715 [Euryarchaeota archaeon SM23-78]MBW3000662.1 tRNA pseudouridine(13) synthase TruD [Candidatus Woesearchaeota archaeon]
MAKKYKIKQLSQDFKVKEISDINLVTSGEYAVFKLKKKNYNTERAVQTIANALKINRKRIGYAGNKDRIAITEQNISIKNIKREKVENLELKDIELKFLGYTKEPVSLGDLKGNRFEIVVRNISKQPKKVKKIINYYGEQRFSKYNAEIGKAIIKKDFKKAVDRILDSIGEDEKKVIALLEKSRNDLVGALKTMPWKILKLYIHAYQSKLWNEVVEELVKDKARPVIDSKAGNSKTRSVFVVEDQKIKFNKIKKENSLVCDAKKNMKIPLIGFATEIKDKELKRVVNRIMRNEQIDYNDFVIRAIPELSSEGSERNLFEEVKDLDIGELEDDELNKGKKKVKISFSLGKGCYATEVVKELFA